jgi:hypothetical protein
MILSVRKWGSGARYALWLVSALVFAIVLAWTLN